MNKKKLVKLSLVSLLSGMLLATQSPVNISAETSSESEVDSIVSIPEDASWLQLPQNEKEAIYSELDKIDLSTKDTTSPMSYSNVKEVKTQQDYTDLILSTTKKKVIVYLGFDECPYCKVFLPKLNQLAKEKDVTIYYYNVRKHRNDSNFQSAMEVYQVDAVPNAFIVKQGKPIKNVNYDSKMTDIEAFVEEAAK